MDESRVKAYMARIGADLPARPDDGVLHDLHLRHLLTVPFENLSIHLDEDIALDEDALVIKIVDRRRGGFCYELNGAFGALLSALGYDVTPLAARVFDDDGPGIPYDHLALRVGPWLVDVGFGRDTHYYPLRLDDRGDQTDPAGTFRIVDGPEGDLDVLQDGRPVYRLETRPRRLRDFVTGCWWHRTSPDSLFTRSVVCSMPTESGRITLNGRKLIRTADGKRDEQELGDDTTVLAAYRTYFGIELDRVPGVGAS